MKNKNNKSLTSPLFYLCTLALTGCNTTGSSRMFKLKPKDLTSASNLNKAFDYKEAVFNPIEKVTRQMQINSVSSNHPHDVYRIIDTAWCAISELYDVARTIQLKNPKPPLTIILTAANRLRTATDAALNAIHTAVKSACQANINIAANHSIFTKIDDFIPQATYLIHYAVSVTDPNSRLDIIRATDTTIEKIKTLIMDQSARLDSQNSTSSSFKEYSASSSFKQ